MSSLSKSKKDTDQDSISQFEKTIVKTPEEAIKIAFDKIFPRLKKVPVDAPYKPFNEVARYWGAKSLYKGMVNGIRELVLQNLKRISQERGFTQFQFTIHEELVQINGMFPNEGFFCWSEGLA